MINDTRSNLSENSLWFCTHTEVACVIAPRRSLASSTLLTDTVSLSNSLATFISAASAHILEMKAPPVSRLRASRFVVCGRGCGGMAELPRVGCRGGASMPFEVGTATERRRHRGGEVHLLPKQPVAAGDPCSMPASGHNRMCPLCVLLQILRTWSTRRRARKTFLRCGQYEEAQYGCR